MEDCGFVIYSHRYVYLGGSIEKGCLKIDSEVYGGDDYWDSEQHVTLTKKETDKLFSICSLEELIELGRSERYGGLLSFLDRIGIKYECFGL